MLAATGSLVGGYMESSQTNTFQTQAGATILECAMTTALIALATMIAMPGEEIACLFEKATSDLATSSDFICSSERLVNSEVTIQIDYSLTMPGQVNTAFDPNIRAPSPAKADVIIEDSFTTSSSTNYANFY